MESELKPRKLTRKQKGFVRDYVATENGTQSALKHYDIKGKDKENIAHAIAVDNLRKPTIQKAIAERLPDDLLEEKHLALLNKMEMVTVESPEGNKMQIESDQIDARAVAKGLDMAYKVKGSYVSEAIPPSQVHVVLVKFINGKDDTDTGRVQATVQ